MTMKMYRFLVSWVILWAAAGGGVAWGQQAREATVEEIGDFFAAQGKTVVTFCGYSGAGYEDSEHMLAVVRRVLARYDPATTLVNVGATPEGIGAVYALAEQLGFTTTGIVSTQAREYQAELSPRVNHAFYVEDATWGGYLAGTERLSPTSAAMVAVSDVVVGIGGGAVSRDEMLAARRQGKQVEFYPADKDHARARERAARKGQPEPADFRGEAHPAFAADPG